LQLEVINAAEEFVATQEENILSFSHTKALRAYNKLRQSVVKYQDEKGGESNSDGNSTETPHSISGS
jgi:hypothetical protein